MALGDKLKECRDLAGLTLRQVEDATLVSNAYLSQLENNKIRKPSANVLYKLSSLYRVPLDDLLYAAGIITDKQSINLMILEPIHKSQNLSDEEQKELIEYLQYLRWRKKHLNPSTNG